jgi:hypothetical protein
MQLVFLICALVGGTILLIQVLLLLLGGGGAGDVDLDVGGVGAEGGDIHVDLAGHGGHGHDASTPDVHHHDAAAHPGAAFTVISFKTVVAFVTFFGLGGLEASRLELSGSLQFLVAVGAGALALYAVGYLWFLVTRLSASGNVNIRNAVGKTGTVYLSIPAEERGAGKVTITVQGRSMEWKAVTPGDAIPTGAAVLVLEIVASDTLKVVPDNASRPS